MRKSQLSKSTILNSLKRGNYTIMYEHECGCSHYWTTQDGELRNDYSPDVCWEGNVLYVYGTPIAQSIRYEGRSILVDTITINDIPDTIWDDMGISEMRKQGESGNSPSHDEREREALIDYLTDLKSDGWRMYRDDERGFANEYTLYLASPGKSHINLHTGEPIDVTELDEITDVEDFASQHLYSGDAATQAYNSTVVLK